MIEDKEICGVIVGRFQVPELTDGHRELLDFVLSRGHAANFIVLGVAPVPSSANNPLDFVSRQSMIRSEYGDRFIVLQLADCEDDDEWSRRLDEMLNTVSLNHMFKLYGSRDSFIKHYTGRNICQEFRQHLWCSGTEERHAAGKQWETGEEFRHGAVFATQQQYPHSYQTVDIAPIKGDPGHKRLILCRKSGCELWRFPGGFVDPSDSSLEEAARRECKEETGLELGYVKYVSSHRIDDWRYRGERDKIMTALFIGEVNGGELQAMDDIADAAEFPLDKVTEQMLVPEHVPLFRAMKSAIWLEE